MVYAQVRTDQHAFHTCDIEKFSHPARTWAVLRRTMVSQLVQHERIETTLPRAKELRRLAEKVVTLGKEVRCSLHEQHEGCARMCSFWVQGVQRHLAAGACTGHVAC